jgi:hypothetical protein
MVNQREAMERLNKEKQYEDKIASDLMYFYLVSLELVPDLTEEQKSKIKESLSIIQNESEKHSRMFSALITYVMNNGEAEY